MRDFACCCHWVFVVVINNFGIVFWFVGWVFVCLIVCGVLGLFFFGGGLDIELGILCFLHLYFFVFMPLLFVPSSFTNTVLLIFFNCLKFLDQNN